MPTFIATKRDLSIKELDAYDGQDLMIVDASK
jgi:hypothetical protein